MKWKRVKSRNVIDVRGAASRSGSAPAIGGGLGLVGVLIYLGIQLLGGGGAGSGFDIEDLLQVSGGAPSAGDPQPIPRSKDPQRDLKDFSVYVFEDAQDSWKRTLGSGYDAAELVLFGGAVSTDGCGDADSAVGPFYCPADSRVYLDLTFYDDMRRELGASGDFAWAYVIAHEIGHHVQNETGVAAQVDRATREQPGSANELSVRQELQADCYAGVWANSVFAEGALEPGDLDEAFAASEAVGDDRLQRQAGGAIDPDSFTHGTSEQRRRWFEAGYEAADPAACDTFSPARV